MIRNSIDKSIKDFKLITGIEVKLKYLQKGIDHHPSKLPEGMQGVYVFFSDKDCFKVGKAGPKSQARWNSHHYNLDKTTPSTFSKSIVKDKNKFKSYFSVEKGSEIDQLCEDNIKDWIRNNISRIELILPQDAGDYALNLLEALVQFELKPIYEGKNG